MFLQLIFEFQEYLFQILFLEVLSFIFEFIYYVSQILEFKLLIVLFAIFFEVARLILLITLPVPSYAIYLMILIKLPQIIDQISIISLYSNLFLILDCKYYFLLFQLFLMNLLY